MKNINSVFAVLVCCLRVVTFTGCGNMSAGEKAAVKQPQQSLDEALREEFGGSLGLTREENRSINHAIDMIYRARDRGDAVEESRWEATYRSLTRKYAKRISVQLERTRK